MQPLGSEAIRALLQDHLGQDPSVAALPQAIEERTKGNPFFIEEVLQSLIESGHLAGVRGACRLTAPVETLDVPASVQAVLASRIDRLAEREKQVLQTASVIGKQFSEALLRQVLASVAPIDDVALDQALAALVAAEFLYEASVYPQVEYSFKHPLTQEVAQRSQLQARRVRTHAAVAQALEDTGGNLDERAAEIAQHWADSGETGRAARWHRRAALWAGLSDSVEALRNWRRVRQLAAGVEDLDERRAMSIEACQQIFFLVWRVGGSEEEIASVFAEGRALIEQTGDRPALAKLVAMFGGVRMHIAGSAADYVRYAEEGARIAAECDDPALRAAVMGMPMWGYYTAATGRQGMAWADRVLAETGTDNRFGKEIYGYSPRASALMIRARARASGRLEEARQHMALALHEMESTGEVEVLTWALHESVFHAYLRGGPGPVLDQARRCLEIAETLDLGPSRFCAFSGLGMAWLIDGQPTTARDMLQKAVEIANDRRVYRYWLPTILSILAETHLALGDRPSALAAAREGIERGRAGGSPYREAQALLSLAQVLLAAEGEVPRAEIEGALDRAEELLASIEARSLSPRILELRGRVAAAIGDAPAAGRAPREALDLYREIGASGHAARLQARDPSRAIGVIGHADRLARECP